MVSEAEKEIVERLFGTIEAVDSKTLKMPLPEAVKIFQSLVVLASDKHARWFKNLYSNFANWQENPNQPLEQVEVVEMVGDDFDMLFYFEGAFFHQVVQKTDEVAAWDMDAKRLQFFEETGQTEKLETLQNKLKEEKESGLK